MEKKYEIVTMYIETEKIFAGTYAECLQYLRTLAIANGNVNSDGDAVMRFWGDKDDDGERVDVGESVIYLIRPETEVVLPPHNPNNIWNDGD